MIFLLQNFGLNHLFLVFDQSNGNPVFSYQVTAPTVNTDRPRGMFQSGDLLIMAFKSNSVMYFDYFKISTNVFIKSYKRTGSWGLYNIGSYYSTSSSDHIVWNGNNGGMAHAAKISIDNLGHLFMTSEEPGTLFIPLSTSHGLTSNSTAVTMTYTPMSTSSITSTGFPAELDDEVSMASISSISDNYIASIYGETETFSITAGEDSNLNFDWT